MIQNLHSGSSRRFPCIRTVHASASSKCWNLSLWWMTSQSIDLAPFCGKMPSIMISWIHVLRILECRYGLSWAYESPKHWCCVLLMVIQYCNLSMRISLYYSTPPRRSLTPGTASALYWIWEITQELMVILAEAKVPFLCSTEKEIKS